MDQFRSIMGPNGLVGSAEEASRLVEVLARSTQADLARFDALVAAGAWNEAGWLLHRMLGALCMFADVPAFASIGDVVEIMRSCDVDRFVSQLPLHRERLLDFVDTLQRAAKS